MSLTNKMNETNIIKRKRKKSKFINKRLKHTFCLLSLF